MVIDCAGLPTGRLDGVIDVIERGVGMRLNTADPITSPVALVLSGFAEPLKVPDHPANTNGDVAVAEKLRGAPLGTNPLAGGGGLIATLPAHAEFTFPVTKYAVL